MVVATRTVIPTPEVREVHPGNHHRSVHDHRLHDDRGGCDDRRAGRCCRGAAHRRHLQGNGRAGVLGQLHAVLLAAVFIHDVVGHGAVLVDVLDLAVLYGFDLGVRRAFHLVTQDGTRDGAHGRGGRLARAPSSGSAADHGAGDGAYSRPRAGFGGLHFDLLGAADLTRHRHLLNDGLAGNHPAHFLGPACDAAQCRCTQ